ncbi:conserved hypothetical protein [Segniliparus rotundus DSM 44985]|uniref:Uncharacterized protein n=1 Tax=Segniliparus rotundus (strain ATCC BAA-972 / CDC 1076 / CIP 108378 / DSM 44985 / JCM 13578) TaxID=640132 RepID=D6Z7C5_SEGRD|nr:WYL domain-containing protein [Segniliparus rotundus]ADG97855.1 conserved hypothetical protein [Segniliparus rotundus DSM 44985]
MATPKVERLINLVIALLSARGYVSAEQIRSSVSGYSDTPSEDAFERMFERDKAELRDLGVPIETGKISRTYGGVGYRIRRDVYELPEIVFTPEEAGAVAVAGTLWQTKELAGTVDRALVKLRAAGSPISPSDSPMVDVVWQTEPGSRGSEEVFTALVAAAESGRRVAFDYRADPTQPFTTRTLEPWGVVTHRGRWYVLGWDIDRDAPRTFRLSRVYGAVQDKGRAETDSLYTPEQLRAKVVEIVDPPAAPRGKALVWAERGEAEGLRRLGSVVGERELAGARGDLVEIPLRSVRTLARVVAGFAAHAVALEPEQLRDEVVARLRAVAQTGGG